MLLVAYLCLALGPGAPRELPHGRCVWKVEMPSELSDWLDACGGRAGLTKRAEAALERHAYMHGWASDVAEEDLVPRDRNAPCSDSVLDLLANAPRWSAEIDSIRNIQAVALCLERNGRVDAAVTVLDRTLAGIDHSPPSVNWRPRGFEPEVSFVAETASEIAAMHGRWEVALDYAARWFPTSWCGNGAWDQQGQIDAFRASCLMRLGRTNEVRELCVAQARHPFGQFNAIAATWLETFDREGDYVAPEVALDMLVRFVGPEAPRDVSRVLELRRLERATADELLSSPETLVRASREIVLPLLRTADDETMRRLAAPLFDDIAESDESLAWILVPSGHPIVGLAFDRVLSTSSDGDEENSILRFREEWQRVRAWLDELSQP